jgi:hypothetical protein
MRRAGTASGWAIMGTPLEASAICPDQCFATIPWLVGLREFRVFAVKWDGPSGEAIAVGEHPSYTYR